MVAPAIDRAFAMADIEGSSRLWNRHPDLMSDALERHDRLAVTTVADHDGTVFKHTGDGFLAAFSSVDDAVAAMEEYQDGLGRRVDQAQGAGIDIRSRVCIHHGVAVERTGDYFGSTINHLARICDMVAPTHVVLSAPAADNLRAERPLDDLGAFPVRDFPEPVALYALHRAGAVGPPLTIAAGRGLITYASPLVGRTDEVARLVALLDQHRLVTLCGFGGMGKTRVAVEAAQTWVATHQCEAHVVDLTATARPLSAVAEAVGLPTDRPAATIWTLVLRHLAGRPMVLVMDNCEHVVEEAADVCARLLSEAPSVSVLATSREPLELEGEVVLPLGPLRPDDAVELLRDPSAVSTAGLSDRAALDLCERVERMPLGIELVASRLRVVDPEALVQELDRGFDHLRSRRRDGTERHGTMRNLIVWSYDLLGPSHRTLLLRLAQFPAPWPRRAAAVMARTDDSGAAGPAGEGGADDEDALDDLVAQSMVVSDRAGTMRLLEPVRHFCLSVLEARPKEADGAERALVRWLADLAPPPADMADPVADPQAQRELSDQLTNIVAALAAARGAPEEADIMTGLWPLIGDDRARSWFGERVEAVLARTPDTSRHRTLIRLALTDTSEHHIDVQRQERLFDLLRDSDPRATSPDWWFVQSARAVTQMVAERVVGADPGPTRHMLIRSAEVADAAGRRLDGGMARLALAYSHLLFGDHADAVVAADDAASRLRAVNMQAVASLADATAAAAMGGQEASSEALAVARSAVPLAEHARWETSVRTTASDLAVRLGEVDEALAQVRAVVDLALDQSVPFVLADALLAVVSFEVGIGELDRARERLDLVGVGRTPVTIALTYRLAAELEFDLGLDRFLESFDPDAVNRRALRIEEHLRALPHSLTVR